MRNSPSSYKKTLIIALSFLALHTYSQDLRVERLLGTVDQFGFLETTPGYLNHGSCNFSPLPGTATFLSLRPDQLNSYYEIGEFYLFGNNDMLPNLRSAFPQFTFTSNLAGNENGMIRVDCFEGSIIATSGRSKWKQKKRGRRYKLKLPNIYNRTSGGYSGTLRVYLLASRSRKAYRGRGKVIAVRTLGQLTAGYYYRSHSATVRGYRAPRGRCRTAFAVAEYHNGRFQTRKIIKFGGRKRLRK